MNREDYLKLINGDVTLALEVCEIADEWADTDPVVLYQAALVLARHYRNLSKELADAREEAKECCEICQNSEWADECWRRNNA